MTITEYEPDQRLGPYTVKRKEPLDHLRGTFYELVHEPTGARHVHIAVPDFNNTFSVVFPTVPQDSTGVAHILEHVVLCGSENFPLRDPFFAMLPRSLKTFMNAMTSRDTTMYPFSTRNTKDFFNLLSIYLDAAFFPRIDEEAFKQEGHRLEFENPEDPESGLRFKGVVFNEMKGAMASAGSAMNKALGNALFPGLTYANNSGGDPEDIPNLTWEVLKKFHAKHYHPSNAYFFSYGNLPLKTLLNEIDEKALSRFEKVVVDVDIPDVNRFDKPIKAEATYSLSKDQDPTRMGQTLVAWVTGKASDSLQMLSMEILQTVLLGNSAAPLHKALIQSGIGDALGDGTGFQKSSKETVFAAGLKGMDPDNAEQVEAVVLDTLKQVVEDGVDQEQVDAAIHQIELRSREVSNAGGGYSLNTFFRVIGSWIYGGDPYRALMFDEDLKNVELERKSGRYFENLIQTQLLDNNHRATLILRPDQEKDEKDRRKEMDRLAKISNTLTEEDKGKIVKLAASLKYRQERDQDLSVLPTLELSDVPMDFEDVPHTIEEIDGATVGWFPQPTNGIAYLSMAGDFGGLDDRSIDMLSFFSSCLTKSGAGTSDYLEVARRITTYTGGIGTHPWVRQQFGQEGILRPSFSMSGKALARNLVPFVQLVKDISSGAKFERGRLKELIAQSKAQLESTIGQRGMQYAALIAASKLSGSAWIKHRIGGIPQIVLLRELAALSDSEIDELIERFNSIRKHVFRSEQLKICVTAEEKEFPQTRALLEELIGTLDAPSVQNPRLVAEPQPLKHEAVTTASPVNYVIKTHRAVTITHPDAPPLKVAGHLMRSPFLHREIREKGGAYGSQSALDAEDGLFQFGSFRDPHIVRTFQIFESAVKDTLASSIDAEHLKEAILASCGEIDPLESPDTKGHRRFFDDLVGYTLDLKSKFKQGLLEVTPEDVKRVLETYLTGGAAMAVVGSPEKVAEANERMGGIFEIAVI